MGQVPLRIALVLHPAPAGGLEAVVHGLAVGLTRANHRPIVLAIGPAIDEGHPMVDRLRSSGVETVPIACPARAYWRERREVAAWIAKTGCVVVHTHGYRPDVLHGGWLRRAGLKTVSTAHGFTFAGWRGRMYERLQRHAWRRFDRVIAVAATLGTTLLESGVPPGRLQVIPNAWTGGEPLSREEARRALGLTDDLRWIGWVGRVSPEKGLDIMIEALSLLPESTGLSVIGDGPARAELAVVAERLGVAPRVRWHGLVPDAGRLARGPDVTVLSSRTEGSPIVLLEAMAAGQPIVATSVGGVPETLSPAEGWLVPVDPEAVAGAIRAVLSDAEAARARGQAAARRLRAERSPESWVARHVGMYRELLDQPLPPDSAQ